MTVFPGMRLRCVRLRDGALFSGASGVGSLESVKCFWGTLRQHEHP
jgi:hypothetical protein